MIERDRGRGVKMESSLCEKPERHASRKLSDYLMLEGEKKVHSLVDKVYSRERLCCRNNVALSEFP
jgi:hypothetical protein